MGMPKNAFDGFDPVNPWLRNEEEIAELMKEYEHVLIKSTKKC